MIRKVFVFAVVVLIGIVFVGCENPTSNDSGSSGDDGDSPGTDNTAEVGALIAVPGNSSVTLYWQAPENSATYDFEVSWTPGDAGPITVSEDDFSFSDYIYAKVDNLESTVDYTFTVRTIDFDEGASPGISTDSSPAETAWEFVTNDEPMSPALDSSGNVYFLDESGVLYSLAADGAERWTTSLASGFFGSVVVSDDGSNVYAVSGRNVYSLDAANGDEEWRRDTGSYSRLALNQTGTVLYTERDNSLVALDATNGNDVWTKSVGTSFVSIVTSRPTIDSSGNILIHTDAQSLYSIDSDGASNWLSSTGAHDQFVPSPPILDASDIAYVGAKGDPTRQAVAIDSNGDVVWEATQPIGDMDTVVSNTALGSDGTLYMAVLGRSNAVVGPNELVARNGADGTELWRVPILGRPPQESPTIGSDGTVYVGTNLGVVQGFDGATGDTVFLYQAPEDVTGSVALAPDGTLYVPAGNSITDVFKVVAVAGTGGGLATGGWPTAGGNIGRAGRRP